MEGLRRSRLTDKLVAIPIAGEGFGAFVYPVAVFVHAVLGRYGWESFGDAAVGSLGFGFFVAHGLIVGKFVSRGEKENKDFAEVFRCVI